MNWIRIFRQGWTVGIEDFRVFWKNWRVWAATHAMRVASSAAMWILLGRMVGSEAIVQFLLIGQITMVGSQFAGWAVQAFTWDRAFVGTYPMLVAAPSSMVPIMMGRTAVWVGNGVASSVSMLVILIPLFGSTFRWSQIVGTVPLLVLVCLSTYGLAFCVGSLVTWAPRLRNVVQNAMVIIMTAICGVVVPITFWPQWVQQVAAVLPVTHGLQGIRLLLADGSNTQVALAALIEATVGVAWFALGVLTLDVSVNAARRTGAIDLI